ncbi:MAG: AmmeMemoRadiSam system protein A [Phycisphaerales bacterium]|jgi:uncharacterized protein|nr:AmmeMemoRadiSam system protein A [Phycisphaerales bacterium]
MTISAEDRSKLATLARQAVTAQVTGTAPPAIPSDEGILSEKRGCFVTLTNTGHLRGCIGTFQPDCSLGELIIDMGQAAAAHDPRFFGNPITPDELGELSIEVSVLSPLEKTDDPQGLELGVHGIYIVRGGMSGCFLPEVATDQGWDVVEFLDHCCAGKAGMAPGAWRENDTTVYLFTSEKFSG